MPWSRKTSAQAIAIQAARRLISGAWSEVAATTTARCMPSGPRTLSTKSRSSRPRSPISAKTTMSASMPRARSPRSEDLPMPEPAKTPMRWPRAMGRMVSKTARPVARRGAEALAGGGRRRGAAEGGAGRARRQRPAVERLAEGVDDAADPALGRVDARRAEERRGVAHRGAVERRVGHGADHGLGDADDLAAERRARRRRGRSPPGRRSGRGWRGRRSPAPRCRPPSRGPTRRWFWTRASSAPSAPKSANIGESSCSARTRAYPLSTINR